MRRASILVVFALSLVSHGQDHPQPKSSDNPSTQADTHAAKQTTPTADTPVSRNEQTSAARPWLSHGEWIISVLTLVYVLLTGFYVVTSHRTLKALRDQGETAQAAAKAAKESADAALQNAKAVVNSQRPWIFIKYTITGDSPRKADIEIRGVNYGPTPAEIVCIDFTCVKQERAASLPIEPSYRKLPDTYSGHVRPGGDFGIFKTLLASEMTDEMWEEMDRKNQRLTYRGRVIYKDVMSGERHESRFYYYFSPQPGGGMIDRSAPPEYYRHT